MPQSGMGKWKRFSESDTEFIRINLNKMSNSEIGNALGRSPDVISMKISSLGLKREKVQSMRKSGTYSSWMSMRSRCKYKNRESWDRYGGRGIIVCERWENSFEEFLNDMGEKPLGYSIDRINPNGNYEPGNCRWIPNSLQSKTTDIFLKIGTCIDCGNRRGNRKGRCHRCNEFFRRNGIPRPKIESRVKPRVENCGICGRLNWGICRKCSNKEIKTEARELGLLCELGKWNTP